MVSGQRHSTCRGAHSIGRARDAARVIFPDSDPGPESFFQRMIRARNRRFQSESIANHTSRTKKNFEENLFIQ